MDTAKIGFVGLGAAALAGLYFLTQGREASGKKVALKSAKYLEPMQITPSIYQYVLENGAKEHPILAELREETSKHPKARMMSSPDQQCFTQWLLRYGKAKKAVEVGVYTGYSALATALALGEGGKLVACDITDEYPAVGRPYWAKAGVSDIIDLRIGPAADTLDKLIEDGEEGTYDYAFVDADKANYKVYYEKLLKLIRPEGIILFDNTLWGGKVLEDSGVSDDDTLALRELNRFLRDDERVEIAMLPIADGVTFVRVL